MKMKYNKKNAPMNAYLPVMAGLALVLDMNSVLTAVKPSVGCYLPRDPLVFIDTRSI
jgi:hypothetical protein